MTGIGQFGDEDLARIREAVSEAEDRSRGEIVTYIVGQADDYPEAAWQGAALGALLAVALVYAVPYGSGTWGPPPLLWVLAATVLGLAVGWSLIRTVAPIKRWLVRSTTTVRVAARAEQAFLEEEVFATEGRTGVLVFIALFERRVVILADTGLHEAVPGETWEALAHEVAGDLARGPDPDAVVAGVRRVGDVLAAADVARDRTDRDEIADQPRLRER